MYVYQFIVEVDRTRINQNFLLFFHSKFFLLYISGYCFSKCHSFCKIACPIKKKRAIWRVMDLIGIEATSFLLRLRTAGFKGQHYGINKSVSRSKNTISFMLDILHEWHKLFLSFIGI